MSTKITQEMTVLINGKIDSFLQSMKAAQGALESFGSSETTKKLGTELERIDKKMQNIQTKNNQPNKTNSTFKTMENQASAVNLELERLDKQVTSLSNKQKLQLLDPKETENLLKAKSILQDVERLDKSRKTRAAGRKVELLKTKEDLDVKGKNEIGKKRKDQSERLQLKESYGEAISETKKQITVFKEQTKAAQEYSEALQRIRELEGQRDAEGISDERKKALDSKIMNAYIKLPKEVTKPEGNLDSLTKELNDLQTAYSENEQELKTLTKEIDTYDRKVEQNKISLEETEAELKDSEKAFEQLKYKLSEIGASGKPLAEELGIDLKTINSYDELRNKLNELYNVGLSEADDKVDKFRGSIQELKTANEQVSDSTNKAAEATERENAAMARVNSIKQRISYFLGLEGVMQVARRAMQNAYQTIKDLDAAMTEMATVTDLGVGDYWEQLPEYTKRANELGVAIKDTYEAATLYYQQGLKTNEVVSISNETLKMARIAGLSAEDATNKMTAALRGFNMELNETSAKRISDVYSELAAITASDTKEISNAMTKTASIASNAGMEFETTAAFLSQIIETTRESAETAGTALKTVIARFQELKKDPAEIGEVDGEVVDANKIETALRSVGVALRDTDGQFRDLDEVFLELASKWKGLDTNTQRYIATIAAGSRQQSRFIAMMSDYGRTQQLVAAANNSAGASNIQFEKTLESLESKLNRLKNAWDSFTMGIMDDELIKGGIDLLTGLLETVNKLTDALPGLGSSFAKVGVVLGGMALGKKVAVGALGAAGTALGIKDKIKPDTSSIWSKKGRFSQTNLTTQYLAEAEAINKLKQSKEKLNVADLVSIKTTDKLEDEQRKLLVTSLNEGNVTATQISLIGAETAAKGLEAEATNQQTKELAELQWARTTEKNLQAGGIAGLFTEIGLRATGKATTDLQTKGVWNYIAAKKVEFIAQIKANSAMLIGIGIVAAYVVAIALLVTSLFKLVEAYQNAANAQQQKLEELQASAQQFSDIAEKAQESLQQIADEKSGLEELRKTFSGLTRGSDEWRETLIEINSKVMDLIETYPELAKYVSMQEGAMSISATGWENVTKSQQEALWIATKGRASAQMGVYDIRSEMAFEKQYANAQKRSVQWNRAMQEEGAQAVGLGVSAAGVGGGAYAGAKIAGVIGTGIAGPVGTAVGAIIGALIGGITGYFAGSKSTEAIAKGMADNVEVSADRATSGGLTSEDFTKYAAKLAEQGISVRTSSKEEFEQVYNSLGYQKNFDSVYNAIGRMGYEFDELAMEMLEYRNAQDALVESLASAVAAESKLVSEHEYAAEIIKATADSFDGIEEKINEEIEKIEKDREYVDKGGEAEDKLIEEYAALMNLTADEVRAQIKEETLSTDTMMRAIGTDKSSDDILKSEEKLTEALNKLTKQEQKRAASVMGGTGESLSYGDLVKAEEFQSWTNEELYGKMAEILGLGIEELSNLVSVDTIKESLETAFMAKDSVASKLNALNVELPVQLEQFVPVLIEKLMNSIFEAATGSFADPTKASEVLSQIAQLAPKDAEEAKEFFNTIADADLTTVGGIRSLSDSLENAGLIFGDTVDKVNSLEGELIELSAATRKVDLKTLTTHLQEVQDTINSIIGGEAERNVSKEQYDKWKKYQTDGFDLMDYLKPIYDGTEITGYQVYGDYLEMMTKINEVMEKQIGQSIENAMDTWRNSVVSPEKTDRLYDSKEVYKANVVPLPYSGPAIGTAIKNAANTDLVQGVYDYFNEINETGQFPATNSNSAQSFKIIEDLIYSKRIPVESVGLTPEELAIQQEQNSSSLPAASFSLAEAIMLKAWEGELTESNIKKYKIDRNGGESNIDSTKKGRMKGVIDNLAFAKGYLPSEDSELVPVQQIIDSLVQGGTKVHLGVDSTSSASVTSSDQSIIKLETLQSIGELVLNESEKAMIKALSNDPAGQAEKYIELFGNYTTKAQDKNIEDIISVIQQSDVALWQTSGQAILDTFDSIIDKEMSGMSEENKEKINAAVQAQVARALDTALGAEQLDILYAHLGASTGSYTTTVQALALEVGESTERVESMGESLKDVQSILISSKRGTTQYTKALGTIRTAIEGVYGTTFSDKEMLIYQDVFEGVVAGIEKDWTELTKIMAEKAAQALNIDFSEEQFEKEQQFLEEQIGESAAFTVDNFKNLLEQEGIPIKFIPQNQEEIINYFQAQGYTVAIDFEVGEVAFSKIDTSGILEDLRGGEEEKWENPYDWLYNYNERITALSREREKIERRISKLLEDEKYNYADIEKQTRQQLKNLNTDAQVQKSQYDNARREMALLFNNADLKKYASYNYDTGEVNVNYDELDKVNWSSEQGQALENMLGRVEELRDVMQSSEDTLQDIQEETEAIYENARQGASELYDRVKEALVFREQEKIDEYSNLHEAITEAQDKLVNSLQEQIDLQRQIRDNQEKADELNDKRTRLAYLRRDTSGANDLEILSLEKELAQGEQDMQDTLVDQAISDLQDSNEKAAEQRQMQIDIAQSQLDIWSESAEIWTVVKQTIEDSLKQMQEGVSVSETSMGALVAKAENIKGLNPADYETKWKEITGQAELTQLWGSLSTNGALNQIFTNTQNTTNSALAAIERVAGKAGSTTWEFGNVAKGHLQTNVDKLSKWEPSGGNGDFSATDAEFIRISNKILELPGGDKLGIHKKYWTYETLEEKEAAIEALKRQLNDRHIKYATGGLADFTGPAWLDGTPSKPEYVLNAAQTQKFFELVDVAESLDLQQLFGNNNKSESKGDSYFDIDINVDSIGEDYDVEQIADKIKQLIYNDATYRNVNAVRKFN